MLLHTGEMEDASLIPFFFLIPIISGKRLRNAIGKRKKLRYVSFTMSNDCINSLFSSFVVNLCFVWEAMSSLLRNQSNAGSRINTIPPGLTTRFISKNVFILGFKHSNERNIRYSKNQRRLRLFFFSWFQTFLVLLYSHDYKFC